MPRIGLVVALLVSLTAPLLAAPAALAQDEPTAEELAVMREARLGGTLASFEAEYGEPDQVEGECDTDAGCVSFYPVEGYDRIQVLYADNKAVWIQLHAEAAPWERGEALELAAQFLPTDTEIDVADGYRIADGDVVVPCRSAALVRAYQQAVYTSFGAAGKRGDCQVELNEDDDGGITVIDVMLGDGPFPAGLDRPEEPLSEEELAYLERTDNILAETLGSIQRFRDELSSSSPDSGVVADVLVFWQTTLPSVIEENPTRTLRPFYNRYVDAAALLGVVASDVTAFIGGDTSKGEAIGQNLGAAEMQIRNLRDAAAAYQSLDEDLSAGEDDDDAGDDASGAGFDEPLTDEEQTYLEEVDALLAEVLEGSALIREELASDAPDFDAIRDELQNWSDLADEAGALGAPSDRVADIHERLQGIAELLGGDAGSLAMVLLESGNVESLTTLIEGEIEPPVEALREEIAALLGS
jgi:hypothetical protein